MPIQWLIVVEVWRPGYFGPIWDSSVKLFWLQSALLGSSEPAIQAYFTAERLPLQILLLSHFFQGCWFQDHFLINILHSNLQLRKSNLWEMASEVVWEIIDKIMFGTWVTHYQGGSGYPVIAGKWRTDGGSLPLVSNWMVKLGEKYINWSVVPQIWFICLYINYKYNGIGWTWIQWINTRKERQKQTKKHTQIMEGLVK